MHELSETENYNLNCSYFFKAYFLPMQLFVFNCNSSANDSKILRWSVDPPVYVKSDVGIVKVFFDFLISLSLSLWVETEVDPYS